jgi:hypothetical protein
MFAAHTQRLVRILLQQLCELRSARLNRAYWWINDSAVTLLATRCKALQELHLDFCQQVTATSIQVSSSCALDPLVRRSAWLAVLC